MKTAAVRGTPETRALVGKTWHLKGGDIEAGVAWGPRGARCLLTGLVDLGRNLRIKFGGWGGTSCLLEISDF